MTSPAALDSEEDRCVAKREHSISLLKLVVQKVYEVRTLLDGYDKNLSYEFQPVNAKVRACLAHLLLAREDAEDARSMQSIGAKSWLDEAKPAPSGPVCPPLCLYCGADIHWSQSCPQWSSPR